jgi:molybdopterin synthase sulfur carrier subunit
MVEVRFFGMVRLSLKEKGTSMEADSVNSLLEQISGKYNSISLKDLKNCLIFVNGRNITELKLLHTPLNDGDRVDVFSPAAGG